MTSASTGRRSSSLQRGSNSGPAKRGQRSSTPSRRLSDLQERPAWDATSSNLDKYKLSAEEQERRRASRISKNRPIASDTSRTSFVEVWAKHVTDEAHQPRNEVDIDMDQDRPRRTHQPASDMPINYRNVVDMLRNPSKATQPTSQGCARASPHNGLSGRSESMPVTRSSSTGHPELVDRRYASGNSSNRSPQASGQGHGEDHGDIGRMSSDAETGAATEANAARTKGGPDNTASGVLPGEGVRGGASPALHRADVSITPVTLRPRFNPSEATTIIAFGEDSDGEEAAVPMDPANETSGNSPTGQQLEQQQLHDTSGDGMLDAVFEAALFGQEGLRGNGAAGTGLHLAWTTGQADTSPMGSAIGDVERRLLAVESALAVRAASGQGQSGSSSLLQDEIRGLRQELRKVQQDNAKLRQELTAFSKHTSAMLTQLQAQLQALLPPSSSGGPAGGGSAVGLSQPFSKQPQLAHQSISSSISAVAATATLGPSAAPGRNLDARINLQGGLAQPPYSQASASFSMPFQNELQQHDVQQQRLVPRRNIFADIDVSALRPLGSSSKEMGGARSLTPQAANHAGGQGHARQGEAESSPPIQVSYTQPSSGVPVSHVDETEVMLPSFAAFRRSAGAAAFTSARPHATALQPPLPPSVGSCETAVECGVSPASVSAVQPRAFPKHYQPRSLGGANARPAHPLTTAPYKVVDSVGISGGHGAALVGPAAAASAATAASGAYAAAMGASVSAGIPTDSGSAAAGREQEPCGFPQPLVFSLGPEFRTVRASGLSADNSMSLSAHTAAATAARTKASGLSQR